MTHQKGIISKIQNPKSKIQNSLLAWYRSHKRDLPWRRLQHDPYAVWVSEIMLQQTQVANVIPYFERWMRRFPTIGDLAAAPLDDVLAEWSGLGYYARARNLRCAARTVVEEYGGCVPADAADLGSLPGIGRYTIGAIRSIAFNQPEPVVDANVARVLCRVFGVRGDPKSAANQSKLYELAESLIPPRSARDFNQALMELGALLCSPSDPACDKCPMLPECVAGNSANPTALPELPAGKKTVRVHHACIVIRDCDRVLMVRRPPHGLWGGLWEFPRSACLDGESPEYCAMRAARETVGQCASIVGHLPVIKHSVMHYAIALHGFLAESCGGEPAALDCAKSRWVTLDEAVGLPLASPQKSILDHVNSMRNYE